MVFLTEDMDLKKQVGVIKLKKHSWNHALYRER